MVKIGKRDIRWRGNYKLPVKPQRIYSELERIRRKNKGRLTPANIVAESTPKKAPLHKCFEWDNSKAAENYRREQARKIATSIEIVYLKPDTEEIISVEPAYLNTKEGKNQFYGTPATIAEEIEQADYVISRIIKSISQQEALLDQLKEIFGESQEKDRLEKLMLAYKSLESFNNVLHVM